MKSKGSLSEVAASTEHWHRIVRSVLSARSEQKEFYRSRVVEVLQEAALSVRSSDAGKDGGEAEKQFDYITMVLASSIGLIGR